MYSFELFPSYNNINVTIFFIFSLTVLGAQCSKIMNDHHKKQWYMYMLLFPLFQNTNLQNLKFTMTSFLLTVLTLTIQTSYFFHQLLGRQFDEVYFPSQELRHNLENSSDVGIKRLIESMMGFRPRQGNLRLVFRLFCLMRGLLSIRLK